MTTFLSAKCLKHLPESVDQVCSAKAEPVYFARRWVCQGILLGDGAGVGAPKFAEAGVRSGTARKSRGFGFLLF